MYPNPQDVLPLPPHPDMHKYRRCAKDLVRACRADDAGAIGKWSARWISDLNAHRPEGARAQHAMRGARRRRGRQRPS
jgi:hypothetical protein